MTFFVPDTDIEIRLRNLRWVEYDGYTCYAELARSQIARLRKAGGKLCVHDTHGFLTTAWLEELNGDTVLMAFGHVVNNTITRGERI